jgi:ribosome-associated toxin RatA of RatAB toxin-antitoxin module
MKIESKKAIVNTSAEKAFNFISDFNNFKNLLPNDKISDYQSTSESCSFNINGMANISMRIKSRVPNSKLEVVSEGKNPFNFLLTILLDEKTENTCEAVIIIDADVNPFVKMMIETPLTNFFNMLSEKLPQMKFD